MKLKRYELTTYTFVEDGIQVRYLRLGNCQKYVLILAVNPEISNKDVRRAVLDIAERHYPSEAIANFK